MDAIRMVVPASAALAMVSAFFGVVLARFLWADDLRFAKEIDAVRAKTELNLRGQISAIEGTNQTLSETIKIQAQEILELRAKH